MIDKIKFKLHICDKYKKNKKYYGLILLKKI